MGKHIERRFKNAQTMDEDNTISYHYYALAGGIPCHNWNIYIDGLWSVFRGKSKNHEKSNTELELFELYHASDCK